MEKPERRFWTIVIVSTIACMCVIVGLRIAIEVVLVDNELRKEEIGLTRSVLKELSDIKNMVGELQSRSGPAVPPEAQRPPIPGNKRAEGVTAGGNPVMGDEKAPVLLVQFSDFQCPFSKRFYQQTFPQIQKDYISTGKVRFAYRDYPLPFHPLAQPAAVAARCAAKQNKYWEMFDKLSSKEELDANTASSGAKAIGLNLKDFNACLKDPAVLEAVKNDFAQGGKYGVSGTPAFFINGRMIEGAYPIEAFKQIIDEELSKSSNK